MTCTTLVYRGVAYIKDDTGRYSIDTPITRSSYLDEKRSSKKKKRKSVYGSGIRPPID